MTDVELEKKAKLYADEHYDDTDEYGYWFSDIEMLRRAYIAGAKENSVIWHDLKKNPDDLPKRYKHANRSPLVITNKGIGHYNFIKKIWYIYNAECNCSFFDTVIAWCEFPKFRVESK